MGLEALKVIEEEGLAERSRVLGLRMLDRLAAMKSPIVKGVRGRGLWVGAEIDPAFATARAVCERLLAAGVLSKETHDTVIRLAPPLVIAEDVLDEALDRFAAVLRSFENERRRPAA